MRHEEKITATNHGDEVETLSRKIAHKEKAKEWAGKIAVAYPVA